MKHATAGLLRTAVILLFVVLAFPAADAQEGSVAAAEPLNAQALKLFREGRYQEAIPPAQAVATIYETALGPEHPDTATMLDFLAVLYVETGAYPKAEPLLRRVLAVREKALGPDHLSTAGSLNALGWLYYTVGTYAEAAPLLQRALEIREKALGPEHPTTAQSLNNLASLYTVIGAYAKAEPLLQRSLAIREKVLGPEHPQTANALNNLAALYNATGSYAEAEPLLQRALAIYTKVLGPEDPETAQSLNNLGELYKTTGAYARAEPLLQGALTIYQKTLGPDRSETANSLNNLAELYRSMGVYPMAEALLQKALQSYERALGPDSLDTSLALNNLGELETFTGNYAQAEPLFQRALTIREKTLGPEHPYTASVLNNLAALYQATGAYAKAESLYQRALGVAERVLGPDHPHTAETLNNIASLYDASGAYTKSESASARAQVIEERNAVRYLLTGSEARKRAYLQQHAGDVNRRVSFSIAHASTRSATLGLTDLLQYKGRVLDAMSDSAARLRRSVLPEDQALFDQLASIAQELSTMTFGGPGKLSLENYRRQLDMLAQQQEKLEGDLSSRSAAFREAVTPITLNNVRRALPANTVLVEWLRYFPSDPRLKASAQWGPPRYVAYVLTHTGNPVAIDLGAAQPIEALVAEFRIALSDPNTTYYKDVAEELSEKLIKPLQQHLRKNFRVLLCPDGTLNLVPFAALLDEHGEYLAEHFELTYLTSGRDLLRMASEALPRGSAVVVANPDYGPIPDSEAPLESAPGSARSGELDRSGLVFTPLAGTAAEAQALQSLLKLDARNVLTDSRATEASLRALRGPRILHVATHGFFLNDQDMAAVFKRPRPDSDALPSMVGENPLLRSGLALAGANVRHSDTTDDGILTAAEVAHLDLLGTQLVVLSACDTGVGTVQTGEGVYGLRRALVLAGAQAQLASLWRVADTATQELMVEYYQRLLNRQGRSDALRAAQQTMMRNPARQHPYYWAAFIPIGNWTPLER